MPRKTLVKQSTDLNCVLACLESCFRDLGMPQWTQDAIEAKYPQYCSTGGKGVVGHPGELESIAKSILPGTNSYWKMFASMNDFSHLGNRNVDILLLTTVGDVHCLRVFSSGTILASVMDPKPGTLQFWTSADFSARQVRVITIEWAVPSGQAAAPCQPKPSATAEGESDGQ